MSRLGSQLSMLEPVWTSDPVDRRGMAAYVVAIRGGDDPARKPRPKGGQVDKKPTMTMRGEGVEHWRARLAEHMRDGEARTFNRMMVEIADRTADMCLGESPEDALWSLVADGALEHTMTAPVRFRLRARAA